MIDLYTFTTPNGRKVSVALEELGLPYRVHRIDITRGDQHAPEYLAINPNGKIPAIVDDEGPGGRLAVFESGAILLYLAEKTGQLLPSGAAARWEATEWLFFQMAGVGPMFGQLNHFARFAKEKLPYAIERYRSESRRLATVLDGRLKGRAFLAGSYSVADVATYPWVAAMQQYAPELFDGLGELTAWAERVGQRPAVQKGMQVP